MDSGVATRPIVDFDAYHSRLLQFVYHSGLLMKPIFSAAKEAPKRIVYAEGEEEKVLRAVQVVVDEGLAKPTLVGRPAVIEQRIERFGLRIKPGVDFEIINPEYDPRYRNYWTEYYRLTERKGVSQQDAQIEMRRQPTLIGAMMLHLGDADGLLCGTFGAHAQHRHFVDQVIGLRRGVKNYAAMNAVIMHDRTIFIADTYVNADPTAEQLAEITLLAAEEIRRFGLTPKVALLSHSSFGSSLHPQAKKMQLAAALINAIDPNLEIDGEMHGDAALSEAVRKAVLPSSRLKGEANLLIMPTLDAANISFNLLKVAAGNGLTLGPMLLGVAKAVHILTPSATVRRIVNMTALTVVDAGVDRQRAQL
jgi:malate dehydrogenase (oxaloacetate-decarboxylating)(NADP+)